MKYLQKQTRSHSLSCRILRSLKISQLLFVISYYKRYFTHSSTGHDRRPALSFKCLRKTAAIRTRNSYFRLPYIARFTNIRSFEDGHKTSSGLTFSGNSVCLFGRNLRKNIRTFRGTKTLLEMKKCVRNTVQCIQA